MFFRFFTILAAVWRFRLDCIALAGARGRGARLWLWLAGRQKHSDAVRLRLALEYLGPIFVKFGQILSTRRDMLRGDFADELAKLQDRVPPEPQDKITAAVENAYGQKIGEVFAEFDTTPCGSASVAQVHKATLKNGAQVAVKILRPDIGGRIRRDVALLNAFAAIAEKTLKDGKRLRPRAVIAEFARALAEETDLLREAANCSQIRRNLAAAKNLRIPAVHWKFCRDNILVMDFLAGRPISRVDELGAAADKKQLAVDGITLFFTQVFRDNFFHADMHPGNVHIDDNGKFILLDFGIVGQLNDFDKEYLLRNFLAFFNRDYRRVAEMHIEAGWTPPDTDAAQFEAELRAVCEPIFAQPLGNISFGRFLARMFRAARKFNVEVQPQLILLQKTLLTVESMGRDLDPEFNMWETTRPILRKWLRRQYSPQRAAALLRRQTPDWFALLADAPLAARGFLRAARLRQNAPPPSAPSSDAAFWRFAALAALGAALAAAVAAAALALAFLALVK